MFTIYQCHQRVHKTSRVLGRHGSPKASGLAGGDGTAAFERLVWPGKFRLRNMEMATMSNLYING
jgi:hypothetical protein